MMRTVPIAARLGCGAALRRAFVQPHQRCSTPCSSSCWAASMAAPRSGNGVCDFAVSSFPRPTFTSRTNYTIRELRPPGIRGVHSVVVTPFFEDESLDVVSFRRLIRRSAEAGCRGVTVLGVLGESNRLVDAEREALIEAAVEEARSIRGGASTKVGAPFDPSAFQICVGTSHAGTQATVQLCQMPSNLGADSVMVAPTAPGMTEAAVLHLYRRICDACPDVPIVVQDHPSSTGVHMSVDILKTIVETVPTVACIKLESLPTVDRVWALRRSLSAGSSECSILTGLGALYSGFDVATGQADGFMTGFAFPEVLRTMHELAPSPPWGDRSGAVAVERVMAVYRHFLPLFVLEQQPGIGLALRKEVLRRRTWISTNCVRQPGPGHLSPAMRRALDDQIDRSFRHVDITQPIHTSDILDLAGVRSGGARD